MEAKDFNKVSVEVQVNGTVCDLSSLELRQSMFGHHTFTVGVNYRAKEQGLWQFSPEQILEQLGSPLSIHIEDAEGASTDFEGVIRKIDIGGKASNQGVVMLYGGSPTVLMTDDYSMASFVDTDLASIVQETITGIGYKIEHKIEPLNNCEIPYICRYKESSYDFLSRLLSACGEWFFYDGKKIIVGFSAEQNSQEPVSLSYRYDLDEMKISSSLGNYDVEQYDYDPTADRIEQWPSYPDSKNPNKFTKKAFSQSKSIYGDYTVLPSRIPVCHGTFNLMENSVYAEHFGKLSGGSMLEAKTRTCKVGLGKIVSVDVDPDLPEFSRELGNYRIVEIVHRYDDTKGSYENEIVGINADIDYLPLRNVVPPIAMPEVAKVVDNQDPKNMGRVKVQFVWQQLEDHPQDKTSGWLRVQTPHAGSSEIVAKDRGFFFIPEIDDQVMVGYEYGDPDRPFVMGSLYHVNNTDGMVGENTLKALRTRSGHILEFNDDEGGDWGITISDVNGNVININTGQKSINISSLEEINIVSKNILLEASENIRVVTGQNYESTIGENVVNDVAGDCSQTIGGDMKSSVTGKETIETGKDLQLAVADKLKVEVSAKATVEVGGEANIHSDGKMYITSSQPVNIAKK